MQAAVKTECSSCGAEVSFASHEMAQKCPFCGSTSVVDRPESANRPDPQLILPFAFNQSRATHLIQEWIKQNNWFVKSDFKKSVVGNTRGAYIPCYLYSTVLEADYHAQIGTYYYVTKTVSTSKGTRTRTERRTDWKPLEGRMTTNFSDIVVTASKGIQNQHLEHIEPYELDDLKRFDPGLVSGWAAEEPSLTRDESLNLAHSEVNIRLGQYLKKFMPGNTHKSLGWVFRTNKDYISLALLPVWIFTMRQPPDKKGQERDPLHIYVNGQTGKVWGRVEMDWLKLLMVGIGITILAIIVFTMLQG